MTQLTSVAARLKTLLPAADLAELDAAVGTYLRSTNLSVTPTPYEFLALSVRLSRLIAGMSWVTANPSRANLLINILLDGISKDRQWKNATAMLQKPVYKDCLGRGFSFYSAIAASGLIDGSFPTDPIVGEVERAATGIQHPHSRVEALRSDAVQAGRRQSEQRSGAVQPLAQVKPLRSSGGSAPSAGSAVRRPKHIAGVEPVDTLQPAASKHEKQKPSRFRALSSRSSTASTSATASVAACSAAASAASADTAGCSSAYMTDAPSAPTQRLDDTISLGVAPVPSSALDDLFDPPAPMTDQTSKKKGKSKERTGD